MSSFYNSQASDVARHLKRLNDAAIPKGHATALRSNAYLGRREIVPPVTKVKWDYDQTQKRLATQYPKPVAAPPPPTANAMADWQNAQDNYKEGRRLYDLFHTWEWWAAELAKQSASGKVESEEQFNEYVINEVYRDAYSMLAGDEKRFEEAQGKAMKDGLTPVQLDDQDLIVFAEHHEDGMVDLESPSMRRRIAVAMPDASMRKRMLRIICWNLQIPYRDFVTSQSAAIPDILDWDSRSVGLGSSRSEQWNMGQPPSVRRRRRMENYSEQQGAWRIEAEEHYEAQMGRRH
ncbi:hypothetical protein LTR85_002507 [Meristemomyces frigidus]|nr:hypothetical protein LTR85_002507 [Meristemomyces frigidus]